MQLSIASLGAFSAELAAVAVFSLPLLCYDVFINFQFHHSVFVWVCSVL